jgi:ABC-type transporter Mla subunit MlaD
MRRLLGPVALMCIVLVGVLLVTGSAGGGGGYVVAAQFDNSGAIVAGEDVEVAGGVVGTVQSLGLTRDYKAVLTLRIDKQRFVPFHGDASCTIRSQGCSRSSSSTAILAAAPRRRWLRERMASTC